MLRLLSATTVTAGALLALTTNAPALANDAVFGGRGFDLLPLKETRVRMASEDILLELIEAPAQFGFAWRVTAKYRFENATDQDIALVLGFPDGNCFEDTGRRDSWGPIRESCFREFVTTVNGAPVEHRRGAVSSDSPWARELGDVHLFDATVPARSGTDVVHTYWMGQSGHWILQPRGDSIPYVTKTGALWNGPIDSARFTVRVPYRPWGFGWTKDFHLLKVETRGSASNLLTTFVFENTQWTPSQDLDLELRLDPPYEHQEECPMNSFRRFGSDPPVSIPEWMSANPKEHTREYLRFCRDLLYARHGRPFENEDRAKFFYQPAQPSHSNKYLDDRRISGRGSPEYMFQEFIVNPDFTRKMLSDDELADISAIDAFEKSLDRQNTP